MQYGLALPNGGLWGDAQTLAELAQLAEDSGWNGVFLEDYNEIRNSKERSQMLEEALAVLVGLWSGEPFHFEGQYYQVEEVTFLPRPLQAPRIPIWVGGGFPLRGPTQRAARWDGACLYRHKTHMLTPEDIHTLRALVQEQRGSLIDYDIAVGGSPRRSDWEEEREHIRSLAEAGVTWWTEYIPPDSGDLETVRGLIKRVPLFVTSS